MAEVQRQGTVVDTQTLLSSKSQIDGTWCLRNTHSGKEIRLHFTDPSLNLKWKWFTQRFHLSFCYWLRVASVLSKWKRWVLIGYWKGLSLSSLCVCLCVSRSLSLTLCLGLSLFLSDNSTLSCQTTLGSPQIHRNCIFEVKLGENILSIGLAPDMCGCHLRSVCKMKSTSLLRYALSYYGSTVSYGSLSE